MINSGTELLMIPGPTTLPRAVTVALSRPAIDIYHGPLERYRSIACKPFESCSAHGRMSIFIQPMVTVRGKRR